MGYRKGDRVRIIRANSEYTGCRGTIADPERDQPKDITVLGHQVAIDGENGVARPFLVEDLEPIRAARVRRTSHLATNSRSGAGDASTVRGAVESGPRPGRHT